MTEKTPTQHLEEAALRLRNSNPAAWDEFMIAMQRYTDKAVYDILKADAAAILGVQAAAQQCGYLFDLFEHCDQERPGPSTPARRE